MKHLNSIRGECRVLVLVGPLFACAAISSAGPADGVVVSGAGSIQRIGAETRITASDGTIFHFSDFDIAAGETVRFLQPSESARVLNRVLSGVPTHIEGSLLANGQVYLVNPSGIVFGNGAVVDSSRFVAAAGRLSDADFLAGRDRFTSLTGAVLNRGHITAGSVALVGRHAANAGSISTPGGTLVIASGDAVTISEAFGVMNVQVRRETIESPASAVPLLSSGDAATLAAFGGDALSVMHDGDVVIRGGSDSEQARGGALTISEEVIESAGGSVSIEATGSISGEGIFSFNSGADGGNWLRLASGDLSIRATGIGSGIDLAIGEGLAGIAVANGGLTIDGAQVALPAMQIAGDAMISGSTSVLLNGVTSVGGSLTAASPAITLDMPVLVSGGDTLIDGAVTLAQSLAIVHEGGLGSSLTFTGAVRSASIATPSALLVDATDADVVFASSVGLGRPIAAFATDSASIEIGSVVTTGTIDLRAPAITLTGPLYSSLDQGTVRLVGDITLARSAAIRSSGDPGNNIEISGKIDALGEPVALVVDAGFGDVMLMGDVGSQNRLSAILTASSTTTISGVRTTGTQSFGGDVLLGGDLSSNESGFISIAGDLTISADSIIESVGDITVGGRLSGPFAIALRTPNGLVNLGADAGSSAAPVAFLDVIAQQTILGGSLFTGSGFRIESDLMLGGGAETTMLHAGSGSGLINGRIDAMESDARDLVLAYDGPSAFDPAANLLRIPFVLTGDTGTQGRFRSIKVEGNGDGPVAAVLFSSHLPDRMTGFLPPMIGSEADLFTVRVSDSIDFGAGSVFSAGSLTIEAGGPDSMGTIRFSDMTVLGNARFDANGGGEVVIRSRPGRAIGGFGDVPQSIDEQADLFVLGDLDWNGTLRFDGDPTDARAEISVGGVSPVLPDAFLAVQVQEGFSQADYLIEGFGFVPFDRAFAFADMPGGIDPIDPVVDNRDDGRSPVQPEPQVPLQAAPPEPAPVVIAESTPSDESLASDGESDAAPAVPVLANQETVEPLDSLAEIGVLVTADPLNAGRRPLTTEVRVSVPSLEGFDEAGRLLLPISRVGGVFARGLSERLRFALPADGRDEIKGSISEAWSAYVASLTEDSSGDPTGDGFVAFVELEGGRALETRSAFLELASYLRGSPATPFETRVVLERAAEILAPQQVPTDVFETLLLRDDLPSGAADQNDIAFSESDSSPEVVALSIGGVAATD